MSGDENFLGRWSRRKQEARQDVDAPAEPTPELASPANADAAKPHVDKFEAGKPHDAGEAKPMPGVPAFDPASLPSIESITSGTDIRAFLAPGVPQELTRAALRRVWAADPAIRDYIGLSEYSWDFNAPDSMFGFEPLRATDDVKKLLAEVFSNREPPAEDRTATAEPEPAQQPEDGDRDETPRTIAVAGANEAGDAPQTMEEVSEPAAPVAADVHRSSNFASQHDGDADGDAASVSRFAGRRRHGGALPKA